MKVFILFVLFSLVVLVGCSHPEEDLRGIPVTNNPHLVPKTSQTAQGPSF